MQIRKTLPHRVFKIGAFIIALCTMTLSCKKDKTEPVPIVPLMYVPSSSAPYAARLMATNVSYNELNRPVSNVWGVFVITRLESGMTDTSDATQFHYEDWQEAYFCGPDGTGFALPANLSLNNMSVPPVGDHYFTQTAWRGNWLNHWEVSRKDSIPQVSANMMDEYPSFTGGLPANVYRAGGFNYTFTPSQVKKADSAYILIHANGLVIRSNTVSVKALSSNTVTIAKDKLMNLHNEYFSLDNKVFYGAVMEAVFFKDTLEEFKGKKFVFTSQREVVRQINLQ